VPKRALSISGASTFVRFLSAALVVSLALLPVPAVASAGERIRVRVYVLDFDPLQDSGRALTEDRGWSDPFALDAAYLGDVSAASAGIVEQRIVKTTVVRAYPIKENGFTFTNDQYVGCLVDSSAGYCDDPVDYRSVLNTAYDPHFGSACDALLKKRVDEVWLWGGPWFGYQEFNMVAPNSLCGQVARTFAVMGFSYERGIGEMVHDFGHRAEFLIPASIGYGIWDRFDGQRQRYAEDYFCPPAPDATHPEVDPPVGHAGNPHFPPNAFCHYQYDRDYPVLSDADDWANYPNLTGAQSTVNASTWGGTQEGFMVWWLGRIPRNPGSTSAGFNDWWRYVYPAGRTSP
jgi:hypothetical protein